MADTIRSEDAFLNASTGLFKDNTAGDISAQDLRDFVKSAMVSQIPLFTGRLTLESGVYVSTTDQTAKSTLYLTGPGGGNVKTWLYDGTSWKFFDFAQISLALSSLTSGKPYDVWLYDNSGTPTLELLVWTNDTTRATALSTQDGVLIKSGDATRRYVGTIYTTSASTTEDTEAQRYLWNNYNQVVKTLRALDTTSSWTLAAGSGFTQRGTKQTDFVIGVSCAAQMGLTVIGFTSAADGCGAAIGIGYDSTNTTIDASCYSQRTNIYSSESLACATTKLCDAGRHYFSWLQWAVSATATFYGRFAAGSGDNRTAGLTGNVTC